MKIEIRYLSKSGNTEKIAKAIAEEVQVEAKSISDSISEETDILFLGGAVYGFGIDEELRKFIQTLDNKVKKVAVFSTSAISKLAYNEIKKYLGSKNIPVFEEDFYCKGKFAFMHKNNPDERDLQNAKEFAKKIVKLNM